MWFKLTSFGNRDDCVRGLVCYGNGGVRDLSQQVHQVTYAIVDNPPVSGEAPDTQDREYIMHNYDTDDPNCSWTLSFSNLHKAERQYEVIIYSYKQG